MFLLNSDSGVIVKVSVIPDTVGAAIRCRRIAKLSPLVLNHMHVYKYINAGKVYDGTRHLPGMVLSRKKAIAPPTNILVFRRTSNISSTTSEPRNSPEIRDATFTH